MGVTAQNGKKLLVTVAFIGLTLFVGWILRAIAGWALPDSLRRIRFWTRQGIHLMAAAMLLIGVSSIWFDDPARLTMALDLVTAGLAFAIQRVITALAAYFVSPRGKTFNVSDRIVMGGVRGDVIALGFTQTTILEWGSLLRLLDAGMGGNPISS